MHSIIAALLLLFGRRPIRDPMRIRGLITARLYGPDGQLKQEVIDENIIPNAGRAHIIDRLQGTSSAVADYLAIGTGSTAEAASQTALVTEVARAQGTLSQPDAYTDRCVYNFPAGTGTGNIQEVARLNAASAGTMMGRKVITAINKTASDSLQITYDFTYAAS